MHSHLYIKLVGKNEQYVKDDEELLGYLTQKALEDASFHVNSLALQRLTVALEQLVKEYREVEDTNK